MNTQNQHFCKETLFVIETALDSDKALDSAEVIITKFPHNNISKIRVTIALKHPVRFRFDIRDYLFLFKTMSELMTTIKENKRIIDADGIVRKKSKKRRVTSYFDFCKLQIKEISVEGDLDPSCFQ